jgi:hypothetical protein
VGVRVLVRSSTAAGEPWESGAWTEAFLSRLGFRMAFPFFLLGKW